MSHFKRKSAKQLKLTHAEFLARESPPKVTKRDSNKPPQSEQQSELKDQTKKSEQQEQNIILSWVGKASVQKPAFRHLPLPKHSSSKPNVCARTNALTPTHILPIRSKQPVLQQRQTENKEQSRKSDSEIHSLSASQSTFKQLAIKANRSLPHRERLQTDIQSSTHKKEISTFEPQKTKSTLGDWLPNPKLSGTKVDQLLILKRKYKLQNPRLASDQQENSTSRQNLHKTAHPQQLSGFQSHEAQQVSEIPKQRPEEPEHTPKISEPQPHEVVQHPDKQEHSQQTLEPQRCGTDQQRILLLEILKSLAYRTSTIHQTSQKNRVEVPPSCQLSQRTPGSSVSPNFLPCFLRLRTSTNDPYRVPTNPVYHFPEETEGHFPFTTASSVVPGDVQQHVQPTLLGQSGSQQSQGVVGFPGMTGYRGSTGAQGVTTNSSSNQPVQPTQQVTNRFTAPSATSQQSTKQPMPARVANTGPATQQVTNRFTAPSTNSSGNQPVQPNAKGQATQQVTNRFIAPSTTSQQSAQQPIPARITNTTETIGATKPAYLPSWIQRGTSPQAPSAQGSNVAGPPSNAPTAPRALRPSVYRPPTDRPHNSLRDAQVPPTWTPPVPENPDHAPTCVTDGWDCCKCKWFVPIAKERCSIAACGHLKCEKCTVARVNW